MQPSTKGKRSSAGGRKPSAQYAVIIDGRREMESKSRIACVVHACKLLRNGLEAQSMQILKEYQVRGQFDKIALAWHKVNGEWRIQRISEAA